MTEDAYVAKIHDLVDGAVDETERAELERHLETCVECHGLLEDLRALKRSARSLVDPDPPERVWEAVSGAVAGRSRARRYRSISPYTALAAALLLGLALWIGVRGASGPPTAYEDDPEALVNRVTEELQAAESHYGKAIDGLEQIIAENDGVIPQELDRVLNENLDLIEGAIQDSRQALRSAPESTVAQESLLTALRRKVSLLQNTILLINEIRKGEGENALDLIDEIRETSDPPNPS